MKRKIPFKFWPGNWGLTGRRLEESKAEYYLEGEELDQKLIDIQFTNDLLNPQYLQKCLDISLKYNKISNQAYEKESATLKKESYFRVLDGKYVAETNNSGQMIFELDWNKFFVEDLIKNGWHGLTEDAVVFSWFDEISRQMAEEDLD